MDEKKAKLFCKGITI
jgi:hypothetical protein